jgi:cytochrome b561
MAAIGSVRSNEAATTNRRWRFPCLVGAIGIAGVLRDAWPTLVHWPPINLHAAFAMMLWMLVVAQFLRASLAAPLTVEAALTLSRRLYRQVYLLLYVVFGAQLVLYFAVNYANLSAKNASLSLPPENLRDYFAYGVIALLVVRALAALSVRRPPALQMNALSARRA